MLKSKANPGQSGLSVEADAVARCCRRQQTRQRPEACVARALQIAVFVGSRACGQSQITGLPRQGHRECETVWGERQVEVARGEAGPCSGEHAPVAIAITQRLQQPVEVGLLASDHVLDVSGARVILRMVGRRDEGQGFRFS